MSMRDFLKNIPPVKWAYLILKQYSITPGFIERTRQLVWFFTDYVSFKRLPENDTFSVLTADMYPRLGDRTSHTNIDPIYFYQNTWCAEKIFTNKPSLHVDIASHALLVGILSKFVKTIMVDIRPLTVTLENLEFKKGSILELPFTEGSVESLSSICVIEHIGLGRYGDPLDQFGTEKAAREIERVMKKGGDIYISVPVDSYNKVYFNAHRAFTREYLLSLFPTCTLIEETYIYGNDLVSSYDAQRGFGTGLYHLKKTYA